MRGGAYSLSLAMQLAMLLAKPLKQKCNAIETDLLLPALGTPPHVGLTGYHIRRGKHNLTEQDWGYFLDFADKVFGQ